MTQGWEIKERLDHEVDAVVDAGECGTEPTTVVDLSEGEPEILRRGAGSRRRRVDRGRSGRQAESISFGGSGAQAWGVRLGLSFGVSARKAVGPLLELLGDLREGGRHRVHDGAFRSPSSRPLP